MTSNTFDVKHLQAAIADMEERTGDLPEWLGDVVTWTGYIDGKGAEELLLHNVRPQIGKAGTNRPQISGSVADLLKDILGANWMFNHQGIAFDSDGKLIDGQHRLEAIVRADKVQPGIMVPIQITWNLPPQSNRKIDLARRRNTGTFLAMDGHGSASRLNTILKLIWLYETADFDTAPSKAHWGQIPDLDTIQKTLAEHPLAVDACNIGGQLQSFITASAAGAAWVICVERYPADMNMEFVAGIKTGANLGEGDPRLALRNWAANRKQEGKRATPYIHMAYYFKAFSAFRRGETLKNALVYKDSVERFPRP
jgi:hypothetical protein